MADPVTFTFDDGTVITFDPPKPVEKPVDNATSVDCASCGACCLEAGHVAVTPDDRTPRALTRSTKGLGLSNDTLSKLGPRCLKRHMGGRCVALEGEVGCSVSCAIYEKRPSVCRRFEAGSPGCLEARSRMRHKISSGSGWRGYGPDWHQTVV